MTKKTEKDKKKTNKNLKKINCQKMQSKIFKIEFIYLIPT